ncbi:MAG: hypothetical protein GTO18_16650 [Anaerolineales bacterium]|nr:hypothetical protein [Anaerolineales bacterium]
MESSSTSTHWIFWPFVAIWRFLTFILELTGRLVAVLLGAVLVVAGIVLSLTFIGAILGVPIALFGFLLMMRGLF